MACVRYCVHPDGTVEPGSPGTGQMSDVQPLRDARTRVLSACRLPDDWPVHFVDADGELRVFKIKDKQIFMIDMAALDKNISNIRTELGFDDIFAEIEEAVDDVSEEPPAKRASTMLLIDNHVHVCRVRYHDNISLSTSF